MNAETILLKFSNYSKLGMVVEERSRGKHFLRLSESLRVLRSIGKYSSMLVSAVCSNWGG